MLVPGLVDLEYRALPGPVKLIPLTYFTWQARHRDRMTGEGAEQPHRLLKRDPLVP